MHPILESEARPQNVTIPASMVVARGITSARMTVASTLSAASGAEMSSLRMAHGHIADNPVIDGAVERHG